MNRTKLSAAVACGALAVLICLLLASHSVRAATAYTLTQSTYGMQLKTPDGRVFLEYLTKKPENIGLTSTSAACFHPFNTPSGERVTNIAPDDHPHHRGIFLAWQDSEFRAPMDVSRYGAAAPPVALSISRADFWGWGQYAPREGRVIQNRDIRLVSADAQRAQLEIHNDWLIGKRRMLAETDAVTALERDGVFVLDLDYTLTPLVDYVINRAAFAGFVVQCRKDGDYTYTTPAGKVDRLGPNYCCPELNWPNEPWYDYTIRVKDSGKVVGVAAMSHPQNPPTSWHNAVWMLQPTIAGNGPITVKQGTTLRLRYRVVSHDGPPPVELLNKLAAELR